MLRQSTTHASLPILSLSRACVCVIVSSHLIPSDSSATPNTPPQANGKIPDYACRGMNRYIEFAGCEMRLFEHTKRKIRSARSIEVVVFTRVLSRASRVKFGDPRAQDKTDARQNCRTLLGAPRDGMQVWHWLCAGLMHNRNHKK